jgi:alpha-galactosidase
MAQLTQYIGPDKGWNDPDLLIGPTCTIEGIECGQTDLQARTQFSLWALFPAPLMISQDVLKWSDYALDTYSEDGVIQINQDKMGKAAIRVQGGNLSFPCKPSVRVQAFDWC